MTLPLFRIALSATVLACAGCVFVPDQAPAPRPLASPARGPQPDCREFQQTVSIGGQTQQAFGMTCRQADGTWKIASAGSPPAGFRPANSAYPAYSGGPYVVIPVEPPEPGPERP
jgi:hypothetical protein